MMADGHATHTSAAERMGELDVLGAVIPMFEDLTPAERGRLMAYLIDRYVGADRYGFVPRLVKNTWEAMPR